MKSIFEYIILLIGVHSAFLIILIDIYAQPQSPPPKLRIAVMNFESNNCPPAFGRAMSEMVTGMLFENELFVLLERNQVDLLLKEHRLGVKGDMSEREALRAGKMLAVDKIALGSVSRFGDFNIEVRIVDVKSGTVDIRVPAKVDDEGDFDDTARFIADRIDFHYHGVSPVSELFDVAVTTAYIRPLGDLADGVTGGVGAHLQLYGNRLLYNIAGRNARVMFLAGYYRLDSGFNSIEYLRMAPLGAFAGCRYPLSRNVDLYPYAGGGYLVTWTNYDTIEERTYERPAYREKYYYNPFLSLRAELHMRLGFRYYLVFSPFYTVFFETAHYGQFAAADMGLKMLF